MPDSTFHSMTVSAWLRAISHMLTVMLLAVPLVMHYQMSYSCNAIILTAISRAASAESI
jgi:hypothetical protein